MLKCPICEDTFTAYTDMRTAASGKFWCKTCQDEFDEIDWQEVYERQLEQ